MWKALNSTFHLFYKPCTERISYEILVSDYINVWSANLSEDNFISLLKENNEGLEFENSNEWIQKGIKMLSNPEQSKKVSVVKKDDGKTIVLSMAMSFGYLFKFECILNKDSEEYFFLSVTQHLLRTIQDLRSSQTELRKLMQRKDKQIDKYKRENGEVAFRHLKTEIFDDKAHMNAHNVYENFFGESGLPANVLEMNVDIPNKATVKQDVVNDDEIIKTEPESQTAEVSPTVQPMTTPSMSLKHESVKTETGIVRKRQKKELNY